MLNAECGKFKFCSIISCKLLCVINQSQCVWEMMGQWLSFTPLLGGRQGYSLLHIVCRSVEARRRSIRWFTIIAIWKLNCSQLHRSSRRFGRDRLYLCRGWLAGYTQTQPSEAIRETVLHMWPFLRKYSDPVTGHISFNGCRIGRLWFHGLLHSEEEIHNFLFDEFQSKINFF